MHPDPRALLPSRAAEAAQLSAFPRPRLQPEQHGLLSPRLGGTETGLRSSFHPELLNGFLADSFKKIIKQKYKGAFDFSTSQFLSA